MDESDSVVGDINNAGINENNEDFKYSLLFNKF